VITTRKHSTVFVHNSVNFSVFIMYLRCLWCWKHGCNYHIFYAGWSGEETTLQHNVSCLSWNSLFYILINAQHCFFEMFMLVKSGDFCDDLYLTCHEVVQMCVCLLFCHASSMGSQKL
jgi:hypothetical protein